MSTETGKLGFWGKFMRKYESYAGKKIVNMVYCGGASVVIIGALFKIMHFPGAGPLLMIGMCTEALLFAIGCFDKPHVDFHWQNVFPQLIGYGADPKELEELASKPRPTLLGSGCEDGSVPASSDVKKANVPSLTDQEFEALKGSITDLANTASQLSELGKIAEKTNKLSEKMEAAGAAADKFIGSSEGVSAASTTFAKSVETSAATLSEQVNTAAASLVKGVSDSTASLTKTVDAVADAIGKKNTELTNAYSSVVSGMQKAESNTMSYEQQIEAMNQKLTTLNSVYELQIKAIQAQVNAFNTQTSQVDTLGQSVQKIQNATNEAAKAGAAYETAAKQLTQQVVDLNKIYGNMLTALKQ